VTTRGGRQKVTTRGGRQGDIAVAVPAVFSLVLAINDALLDLRMKLCLVCSRRAAATS
jgi:hypothetical protein